MIELAKTLDGPVGRGTTGRQVRLATTGFPQEDQEDRRFTVESASSAQGILRTSFAFEPRGAGTLLTVRLEMESSGGNSRCDPS